MVALWYFCLYLFGFESLSLTRLRHANYGVGAGAVRFEASFNLVCFSSDNAGLILLAPVNLAA